jgi:uncharacterized protein
LELSWVAAGAALVGSYPLLVEPYLLGVNTYEIFLPNLPPAFDGFTIVHLTDLHYSPYYPLPWIADIVQRANALPKAITVLTGDYVHGRNNARPVDEVWPVLGQLQAPEGVYAVLGNHDHWASESRSRDWLERTGFNLSHRLTVFERQGQRLWLGGTGDLWEDRQTIDEVFADVPAQDCKIVLAHNPDSADRPFHTRLDLMLSGHTHGGQVIVPGYGPPRIPVQNKRYTSGLIPTQRFPVFISRGTGWAIYPVRFNCPPEIARLVLKSA